MMCLNRSICAAITWEMSYKEGDYSYKKVVLRVLQEITVLSTFVSVGRWRAAESGGVIWQLCHFLFGMQQRIHRVKVLPCHRAADGKLESLLALYQMVVLLDTLCKKSIFCPKIQKRKERQQLRIMNIGHHLWPPKKFFWVTCSLIAIGPF